MDPGDGVESGEDSCLTGWVSMELRALCSMVGLCFKLVVVKLDTSINIRDAFLMILD